jgi:hypothetical protein
MIGIAPLVLVALIGVAIYAFTRHGHHAPQPSLSAGRATTMPTGRPAPLSSRPRTTTRRVPEPPPTPLQSALRRWLAAGIISPEQATAIETHEQLAAQQAAAAVVEARDRPRRVPVVAEALGYLGGTLGIVGLVLLVARYWPDMPTATRLGLTGGAALALAVAGFVVREQADPALTRLRWFLWTVSTAAAGLFGGVLAADALGAESASTIALTCAAIVTVQNAILWWSRERPIQQLLCLAGGAVTAGTAVDQFAREGLAGAGVWVVGVVFLVLALRHLTTLPALTAGVGAAAVIVGAGITTGQWEGPGLIATVLTASCVLALAAIPGAVVTHGERTVLTVVGAIGMFQVTPGTVVYFAHHAGVATGLVVWVAGCLLVLVAARRMVSGPIAVEVIGSIALLAGAAVTGVQSPAFATTFGILTSISLIALGTMPGRVLLSLFGSLGLLVNVPWAISHFFPGEGRAPLLILASGAVIVAVSVWLARMGGRFRSELRR